MSNFSIMKIRSVRNNFDAKHIEKCEREKNCIEKEFDIN